MSFSTSSNNQCPKCRDYIYEGVTHFCLEPEKTVTDPMIEQLGTDQDELPRSMTAEELKIENLEAANKALTDALDDVIKERDEAFAKIERLSKFKSYTHQRLDKMGVQTHPEGEHSKQGCRIGDRLDIVERSLEINTQLFDRVEKLEAELSQPKIMTVPLHPKDWNLEGTQTCRESHKEPNKTQLNKDPAIHVRQDDSFHSNHYKKNGIEPIDYAAANNLDPWQFNIIKYVTRFRDKNGMSDLLKALRYVFILISVEKGMKPSDQSQYRCVLNDDDFITLEMAKAQLSHLHCGEAKAAIEGIDLIFSKKTFA